MTKKALLFAALAASCLSAIGADKPSGYASGGKRAEPDQEPVSAARCQGTCTHKVTIVDVSANPCKLKVDPEVMWVYGGKPAVIVWNLVDAPEGFKLKVVKFKDESPAYLKANKRRIATPSQKQFHDKHVSNGDKTADVTDDNSIDGAYYYNLEATDGKKVCTVDPPIINGN
jgi:hypothetical protein